AGPPSVGIGEPDPAPPVRDGVAAARAVEPARPVRAEAPETLVAAVDEARIRQVLANLLGNVREHTPVTTPTAVRLAQVRGGVVLEVADAGPGMATDDAAPAFDRFYRGAERPGAEPGYAQLADGVGSARGVTGNGQAGGDSGGSGLGLAIVAAIAQAHGGQATLESAPGHGTRVRVWLPAAPPAAPRAGPAPGLSLGQPAPATPARWPLPRRASRYPSRAATAASRWTRNDPAGRQVPGTKARTRRPTSLRLPRPGWAGARTGSTRRARRR